MLMKKITFFAIAVLLSVVAFAQKQALRNPVPFKAQAQLGQMVSAKQLSKDKVGNAQMSTRSRARKLATGAADLVGDYTWNYLTADTRAEDPNSVATTEGSAHVTIEASATTEGGLTISGLFPNSLEATVESSEAGDFIRIPTGQTAGNSSYGYYTVYGMYYYAGDEENEAGWYFDDIYVYPMEDGSLYIDTWICRVLTTGDYSGYMLTPYWVEGSTLTPAEPLAPVALPEGLEVVAHVMTYDGGSTPVNVAVDGNDVYFQGMSYYVPDAWVKGTKEGDQVTFEAMQYMGEYGSYGSSFFFYNGKTVFTYDAEAGTYSAEGQVFGVLADRYYDGNYTNPVIAPIVEKAVMPADPEITNVANGNYGWYMNFNVPLMDVNGDGLVASKLAYRLYVDVERQVSPLVFTPATHQNLTEDMSEFPYGFTENYDFYDTQIYFNDLFSEDWNRIGIQSVYYGGDETNETEIQWYEIKPYKITTQTFNFNEMNVDTSSSTTTDGDILQPKDFTEGNVTLTISPRTSEDKANNRFWATTTNGPQLRVYSGTLTFTAASGYAITGIEFNAAKWNEGNTADWGAFDGSTWTGEAQTVVVSIAGNSQINSINVTTELLGAVTAPEGLAVEPYTFKAFMKEYNQNGDIENPNYSNIVRVGFDGDKAYIQGLSTDVPDLWVKAIKNKDGKYVIPSNQYMGDFTVSNYTFPYYWTAVDETGACVDAVLNFNPETSTFTTDQTLALNGAADSLAYYMLYNDVTISPFTEVAATPANPAITGFSVGNYGPVVRMSIPTSDTEGNALLPEKLYYQFFTDVEGVVEPLVLDAANFRYLEEDLSIIPYNYDDAYDIYRGSTVYLNTSSDEWNKIGIKSIYTGGGETKETEIQWYTIKPYSLKETEGSLAEYTQAAYDVVTLKYTLKAGWNTIVLPFTTDLEPFCEGAKAYELTDAQDGVLSVNTVYQLKAQTPYIIYAPEDMDELVFYNVADFNNSTDPADLRVEKNGVTFQGTYAPIAAPGMQGKYGITGEGGIQKGTANASIKGFRAYFEAAPGAQIKAISFDGDDATGIAEIANSEWLNTETYNLAGQRIQKAQKGVNIVNGKKVLY